MVVWDTLKNLQGWKIPKSDYNYGFKNFKIDNIQQKR